MKNQIIINSITILYIYKKKKIYYSIVIELLVMVIGCGYGCVAGGLAGVVAQKSAYI